MLFSTIFDIHFDELWSTKPTQPDDIPWGDTTNYDVSRYMGRKIDPEVEILACNLYLPPYVPTDDDRIATTKGKTVYSSSPHDFWHTCAVG